MLRRGTRQKRGIIMAKPKKTTCKTGKVERIGYTKSATVRQTHTRKGYTKRFCPKGQAGCKGQPVSIPPTTVKEAIIPETYVPPTCIPDVGKAGKTPESQKWFPRIYRGELGQYFDDGKMKYDPENCVKAGIRASKLSEDTYSTLSGKFVSQENLRMKVPDRIPQAREFEECRQNALIGFNPIHKPPKSEKNFPDMNVNAEEAKRLRSKLLPEVDQEFQKNT